MVRLKLASVLLILAFVAAEPVVHTHPLTGSSRDGCATPNACAACAVAAHTVATAPRIPISFAVVLYTLPGVTPDAHEADVLLTLAPRAPPAAR